MLIHVTIIAYNVYIIITESGLNCGKFRGWGRSSTKFVKNKQYIIKTYFRGLFRQKRNRLSISIVQSGILVKILIRNILRLNVEKRLFGCH